MVSVLEAGGGGDGLSGAGDTVGEGLPSPAGAAEFGGTADGDGLPVEPASAGDGVLAAGLTPGVVGVPVVAGAFTAGEAGGFFGAAFGGGALLLVFGPGLDLLT